VTNDAAERLREYLGLRLLDDPLRELLDAALAAERRATVERLAPWTRHWIDCNLSFDKDTVKEGRWVCTCGLDAEAER
jgi:hypothetical protein